MKKLVRNISILLIALLLACCLIVGFTACGDDDSSSSGSGSGTEQGGGNEGGGNEGGSSSDGSGSETTKTFEAELTDLVDETYGTRQWNGYSQQASPIIKNSCFSNGYALGCLYVNQAYIFFSIYSDVDAEAELYATLTMGFECKTDNSATSVTLSDSQFTVWYGTADSDVDNQVKYGSITYDMTGLTTLETYNNPVERDLGKIELKAGWNVVQLMTSNQTKGQGGTMYALAPIIDCIRLDTTANTSYNPVKNV